MKVELLNAQYAYTSTANDWRLIVGNDHFEICPNIEAGLLTYFSGHSLDSLAELINEAKAHAIANGINWAGS